MTRWEAGALRVAVLGLLIALALLSTAFRGDAQPPRDVVLDQYARDVKEHRDWLESQLAAAKASITTLQSQLAACGNQSAPRVLPRAEP